MVSKSTDSASKQLRKLHGEHGTDSFGNLTSKIHQLKKQIQAERAVSIREKLEDNGKKLEGHVSKLLSATTSRNATSVMENSGLGQMLSSRIENPLCMSSVLAQESGDKDNVNTQEFAISKSAKLPYIEKIPPYTTWIFLERNQKMAEDQSVVGRRRIYYDPHGSEALICSDSEEEVAEPEELKREFSEGEDRILWMALQDHGLGEEVLHTVSQLIGGTTLEIKERYNMLKEKSKEKRDRNFKDTGELRLEMSTFLEKSLSATLDSFDNLFCRRCLVFDCRLHGCSQNLISPSEKQSYSLESEEDGRPCSDQCYLQLSVVKDLPEGSAVGTSEGEGSIPVSPNAEEQVPGSESMGKRKVSKHTHTVPEDSTLVSDGVQGSSKKQKNSSIQCDSDKFSSPLSDTGLETEENGRGEAEVTVYEQSSSSTRGSAKDILSSYEWKPLEKDLYLKGIEIFGRNSCLIARNLLSGLKTCTEVSNYMNDDGAAIPHGSTVAPSSYSEDNGKAGADYMEREVPIRSRLLRRRGKARKLKYSWKSAGHPSIWKRIADGKNQSCKQYTPCGCQSMCGKQCPCLHNGTCCEKYCGCSKSCKNRFRGCHCAKSQCRSRQCPCFAAERECDPDVCRNCWVSCGDGSLGEPARRGDGQCGNMRLFLGQQQRILLAKSDVAGWGAFLKNPVNKNDYLGEYTGELISHREADKRGKIYDLANSSFLFDLNDQYVLDAYRKGDKLKFANHSSNPNCYAKVMLVAGDHRVGIFAKEHIEGSEELFYDYRYGPDQAPVWARKPEGSKGDFAFTSQGRAKKHQSH